MCVSASLSHITFVTAHCESIRALFECRWGVSINQQRWLIKYATCYRVHATCHMQLALFAKFATFVLSHCLLAHIPMAQWVNLLCNGWGYVCECVCVWGSCCIDVWVCVCVATCMTRVCLVPGNLRCLVVAPLWPAGLCHSHWQQKPPTSRPAAAASMQQLQHWH